MIKTSNELPYFITWTKQDGALTLPLDRVDQDYFYSGKKKWLNLSSISYQASFGMNNKSILNEMKKQMDKFSLASPKQTFKLKQTVSEELIERTKGNYKCFYTQSGSEGIENALKMARQISGKKIILSQARSYHGATMGSLAITGDWRHEEHLLPLEWTKKIPDPQEDPEGEKLEAFVREVGPSHIAAICVETITGGNGVYAPSSKWYKKLMELKKLYGFYIILDEVVCAAHRTGPFMGFHNFRGLKPDFIVTAKAMTGGYFPLGVLLVSDNLAKFYDQEILSCGLTNYGHPLGLAALKAVLKITKTSRFKDGIDARQKILKEFLREMRKNGLVTRQHGLLAAIELNNKVLATDLFQNGIYGAIQNDTLILAPSLVMSTSTFKRGLSALGDIINEKLP